MAYGLNNHDFQRGLVAGSNCPYGYTVSKKSALTSIISFVYVLKYVNDLYFTEGGCN